MKKDILTFLENCPNIIKDSFLKKYFEPGDKILSQNEASHYVYILRKGRAKVYFSSPIGVIFLEYIYNDGELFGEVEVLNNKPILSSVEAISFCEVIQISKENFINWLKFDGDFSLFINKQLADKLYMICIHSETNIIYPLKYRLLFFLQNHISNNYQKGVPKDILVEGLGSNTRSINRIIKELVDEGIIIYDKGIIKIASCDKLKEELKNF